MTFAPDASELEGYRICRCGDYVHELTFMTLGHMCWRCYENSEVRNARLLNVLIDGQVRPMRLPRPRRQGSSRGSKGARSTRDIRKKAERAALIRLKAMFPEAYALLYTEERIRRGLPVVPKRGVTTDDLVAEYSAAVDRGER